MENEKLWNANYNRVMFTNFTLFLSLYLLSPLLPLYLSETFGATKETIGLVLSGYTLVALLTRPFSGFIVDSFPRKKVLLLCLFVYFLCFGGYLLAGSLVFFALIRTLHGGPFGASTVANSTMAIDVLPSSRRNEGIGLYGLSNNLASAIAPMLGIFIYDHTHNFQLLFWIAFVIAALGLVSAWFVRPKERQVLRTSVVEAKKPKLSLDRFFLTRGWFLALNVCFFGFCWSVLSNYLAIYGKEKLGMTGGTGTYFLILSAGLIVSRLVGNKSLRQGRLVQNATIGVVLSTIGYVLFIAWPSMFGYYASAILIGLGNGHMWPAFQNMIIAIAKKNERGTANSTILTSWDLGMGLGILLGGSVAEFLGYDSTFRMMACAHIVGLAVYWFVVRTHYSRFASTMHCVNNL